MKLMGILENFVKALRKHSAHPSESIRSAVVTRKALTPFKDLLLLLAEKGLFIGNRNTEPPSGRDESLKRARFQFATRQVVLINNDCAKKWPAFAARELNQPAQMVIHCIANLSPVSTTLLRKFAVAYETLLDSRLLYCPKRFVEVQTVARSPRELFKRLPVFLALRGVCLTQTGPQGLVSRRRYAGSYESDSSPSQSLLFPCYAMLSH